MQHFSVSILLLCVCILHQQIVSVESDGRVVGYYQGNRAFTSSQATKLTHLILAFSVPDAQGNLSPLSSVHQQAVQTARSANGALKLMIAIGGGAAGPAVFAAIAADRTKRSAFIAKIVSFLIKNKLDGADIDWEFPTSADKANYVKFLCELRTALAGKLLSIASAAGQTNLEAGFDLPGISSCVNFINVMCYDYYGSWTTTTGPNSPLYSGGAADPDTTLNTAWTINYHLSKMNNPAKLNMGVPFYAKYWNNVGAPVNGDGLWRKLGTYGTELAWRDLSSTFNIGKAIYHPKAKTPYLYDSASGRFLTFDNPQSLADKKAYAGSRGVGLMIWSIDQDDDQNKLLSTLSSTSSPATTTTTTTRRPPPPSSGSVIASAIIVNSWGTGKEIKLQFKNNGAVPICGVKFRLTLPSGTTKSSSWNMNLVSGTTDQYTLPNFTNISPGKTFGDAGLNLNGSGSAKPTVTVLSSKPC